MQSSPTRIEAWCEHIGNVEVRPYKDVAAERAAGPSATARTVQTDHGQVLLVGMLHIDYADRCLPA
ncbi:hypothetical protein EVJ58_g464 [Rhodofomes roseus]|uniref:Uncharacterized protein n=1 Tax=Rhodofomes roseus TaxID=34475 RepID=A0A4Y9Z678_9APHY|nr:hypothetical protein EVJ58_g464 [Rhodofomes roseus]